MKILSLFDGMGSGALAARRANLKVSKYEASEIDADAIKVACHNNAVIEQLGDDYFDGMVSKTKATRMLGNGWTIDVIASILRGIA